jgi:hypothetical protein
MTNKNEKSETAKDEAIEEADVETDQTDDVEESDAEDSEEKSKDEAKDTDNEIDYDAEIDKEKKGKPDPIKAKNAFKERTVKREESEEEVDDDDKPMTRKEARELIASTEKKALVTSALQIARGLSTSEKEAQLLVAKWENRTFPSNSSLSEQIEEMYAVVHRKKIIGERNEALRSLKNRGNANNNTANGIKDPTKSTKAPTISADMKLVITQSKLVLNNKTNRYERKLPNGDFLVYDVATKSILPVKAS